MSKPFESGLPSDIRLLLRADAEQQWLHHEVIPVLQHLETGDGLEDEEVGAALAYLEAMWNEAGVRARHTDAAHLNMHAAEPDEELSYAAGRYHAAVRVLRDVIGERVAPLVSALQPQVEFSEDSSATLRVADSGGPSTGGWAPWAA
jgi:hypothetical protein